MTPVGLTLLTLGTATLILNAGAWLDAYRDDRRTERLTPGRRALVYCAFPDILTGTAMVWTSLL